MFPSCFVVRTSGIESIRVGTGLHRLDFPANVPVEELFKTSYNIYAVSTLCP